MRKSPLQQLSEYYRKDPNRPKPPVKLKKTFTILGLFWLLFG
jgi:hypothetical protein